MNFLFAWRYFKAKKTTNAINIIAWVSVVAITLITASFVVLLSVFNGFEGLVKSLYSSFYAELRVGSETGKLIQVTDSQFNRLRALPGIRAYSAIVEEKALLQNGDLRTIVFLKGVEKSYEAVTAVSRNMIRGDYQLGSEDQPGIVLGGGIEHAVAADVERSIFPMTVYLFKRGVNVNLVDPVQSFAADNITGTGTFYIQQDIDNKYALTNIAFMKRMLGLGPQEFSSIEIAVTDPASLDKMQQQVQGIFGAGYLVQNRFQQNQSLYSVMALEKWAIYGILTLMLIVAAFTLVGALTMLVLEKQKDIQVLKAIGASSRLVQKIFLSEGLLLGIIGVGGGLLLGMLLCWAQEKFHLVPIAGGTFLINYYPVKLALTDLALISSTVLLVALLASWFPSRKAALQPVELRS